MMKIRIWRCVGAEDLQFVTDTTAVAALFILDEQNLLGEVIDGKYEGLLLSHRELITALQA